MSNQPPPEAEGLPVNNLPTHIQAALQRASNQLPTPSTGQPPGQSIGPLPRQAQYASTDWPALSDTAGRQRRSNNPQQPAVAAAKGPASSQSHLTRSHYPNQGQGTRSNNNLRDQRPPASRGRQSWRPLTDFQPNNSHNNSAFQNPQPYGTHPQHHPQSRNQNQPQQNHHYYQQYPSQPTMSAAAYEAFSLRARAGAYRGRGDHHQSNQSAQSHQSHHAGQFHQPAPSNITFNYDDPRMASATRSRGNHYRLYNPHQAPRAIFGDQQSHPEQKLIIQREYMNVVASHELKKTLISEDEVNGKHAFRKVLQEVARHAIANFVSGTDSLQDAEKVELKCYGSLANGFAMPGSDMDLLMLPGAIPTEAKRMLEGALLNQGIGARLLTGTRVPILRVCQRPDDELLKELRKAHAEWEEEEATKSKDASQSSNTGALDPDRLPDHGDYQSDVSKATFAELEDASMLPLPPSPERRNARLEFKDDVGIQCDINFSNYVAIYNTKLLRLYSICDSRVQELGLLVKSWAKLRKINTPYHGTLSSYGYVMMVLHFLMNIANPPVIPNLQLVAKRNNKLATPPVKMVDGFDVLFEDNEDLILSAKRRGKLMFYPNTEDIGALLRGFFKYYGEDRGFYWKNQVISIRTEGGLLQKHQKGWTELKRTGLDGQIRNRYNVCIEDPFEIEHNIARTVGHSGICAIRDEFRRARMILDSIQYIPNAGWMWRKQSDGSVGEDLFAEAEDRGDLLKQDADYGKERAKREKREVKKQEGQSQASNGAISATAGESSTQAHGGGGGEGAESSNSKSKSMNDSSIIRTYGQNSTGDLFSNELREPTTQMQTHPNKPKPKAPPLSPTFPSSPSATHIDPRQLADLTTISLGGNGCARGDLAFDLDGAEGGGGRMGEPFASTKRRGGGKKSMRKVTTAAKKETKRSTAESSSTMVNNIGSGVEADEEEFRELMAELALGGEA